MRSGPSAASTGALVIPETTIAGSKVMNSMVVIKTLLIGLRYFDKENILRYVN
jgi:hypothetical protein